MRNEKQQLLVYGYGNPGRSDDGLGFAFCEAIERLGLTDIAVQTSYQINIEVAATLAENDIVLFVDASRNDIESFRLAPLRPLPSLSFTTHAMSPQAVLALCHELYTKKTSVFILEIKGFDWGSGESLSTAGSNNLRDAVTFMAPLLKEPTAKRLHDASTRCANP
ncbi:MAG: hydrogenase maturation protease [Chitinivibrionales bacterium]|nr:hydrogenase maturation protease [Chitinivibrionales bacterium]MBD3357437.1 hydrogenase maturation protease [Chitinivibrionales bacterium]